MTRKNAREIALGCVFECLASGADSEAVLARRLDIPGPADLAGEYVLYSEDPDDQSREYISFVTRTAEANRDALLAEISAFSEGWKLERLALMTKSILLLSMTEILFRDDVPAGASINEAVELAKKYDAEKSPAFVNGLLGRFLKSRSAGENA
ncbi:MAG: transcription antitermination factor NusB [Clostridiales bacterium]|nr:transcription antitermination factor NusB [Clostridiales bacterium]